MIKSLILISIFFLVSNLYAQNLIPNDSINYELDRAAIDTFTIHFANENDSIQLQKYIQFPEFSYNECDHVRGGFGVGQKMSEEQIKKAAETYPYDDPFIYWKLKNAFDDKFQKSLIQNNISVEEYCYKDEKCRIAMCGYIIRNFNFSKNCPIYLGYSEKYKAKKTPHSILELGCNYYKIGIIKINNEFKVLYININFYCD